MADTHVHEAKTEDVVVKAKVSGHNIKNHYLQL
jgi:hypothetical protein